MSVLSRLHGPLAMAAVAVMTIAAPALAADLGDEPPPDRWSSAYEDPRYAYLYGRTPPPPPPTVYAPPPRRYSYDDHPPVPREPVYRDRYAYAPPPREGYADRWSYDRRPQGRACLSREAAREAIERQGWSDFHDVQVVDHGTAYVKARRPSGRLFELQIDRCSGEVVNARPLEPRYRPYADRGEWRPPRAYY